MQAIEVQAGMMGPKELDRFWPNLQGALEGCPEIWEATETIESLRFKLLTGNLQAWAVGSGGTAEMVAFTQVVQHAKGATLQILWAAKSGTSTPLLACLTKLEAVLERFADSQGCETVQIFGRPGWERILRRFGCEFEQIVLSRPVKRIRYN